MAFYAAAPLLLFRFVLHIPAPAFFVISFPVWILQIEHLLLSSCLLVITLHCHVIEVTIPVDELLLGFAKIRKHCCCCAYVTFNALSLLVSCSIAVQTYKLSTSLSSYYWHHLSAFYLCNVCIWVTNVLYRNIVIKNANHMLSMNEVIHKGSMEGLKKYLH